MKTFLLNSSPLILVTLLAGCGKAKEMPDFESGGPGQVITLPADGSNIKGKYQVDFITLNTQVNGFLTYSGLISKKENKFSVSLKIIDSAPNVWHRQAIYTGRRCPFEQDDLNQDGLIDIDEGNKIWGRPLIPLDTNINSQDAGKNVFPISDDKGVYVYKRSADFDSLFKDLKSAPHSDSTYAKLTEEEGLSLDGSVIVIFGTDESANLPDTVATEEGLGRHQSFPLACGLIKKISDEGDDPQQDSGNLGNPDVSRARAPLAPEASTPPTLSASTSRNEDEGGRNWGGQLGRWWRRIFGRESVAIPINNS